MKFAAIDIGSNAVRLLLSLVLDDNGLPFFKKESLVRIPIRLGRDAFTKGSISDSKTESLILTMQGFHHLIKAYNPVDFMACATSAMREARNGRKIVARIEEESGIKVEIVDGRREAEIIYANHIEQSLGRENGYRYIDVGGGSTELTLFSGKKSIESKSFDIGTIRLLKNLVTETTWKALKTWVKDHSRSFRPICAIGSGGNINKIFRLTRKKEGKPLTYNKIKEIYQYLGKFSWEDRIRKLGLRPDRADVILPAARIYLKIMKWGGIGKMYVPQIGLPDGLIHIMYENLKNTNNR